MLTIFSTLKPFRDPHISMIQRNAIQSWLALKPKCEILLLGNNEGIKEVAREFKVRHAPKVETNEKGLPLIRSLFTKAQQATRFPLLCYVNGDIILLDDFLQAVKKVFSMHRQSLAVGRRWDIEIKKPIDFSQKWQPGVKTLVKRTGVLHGWSGIDYFVFPKGMFNHIPPLVVGRAGWDNWMIYHARSQHIPVVNLTAVTTVIHQGHDLPGKRGSDKRFTDESAKQNIVYAGGFTRFFTIRDANWELDQYGLREKPFAWLSFFPLFRLLPAIKRKVMETYEHSRSVV